RSRGLKVSTPRRDSARHARVVELGAQSAARVAQIYDLAAKRSRGSCGVARSRPMIRFILLREDVLLLQSRQSILQRDCGCFKNLRFFPIPPLRGDRLERFVSIAFVNARGKFA